MQTREFYGNISERYYAETFGKVDSLRAFQRTLRTELVLEAIDRLAGNPSVVADLGCGPGQYAKPLLDRGFDYIGMDLVRDMYREVARTLAGHGKARFLEGSIEKIPLDTQSVDLALAVGVLEYLPSDGPSLSEIARILKPGGLAIVTFPNLLNPVNFLRVMARPVVAPVIRGLFPDSSLSRTVFVARIPHRTMAPARFRKRAEAFGFHLAESRTHGYCVSPWDRSLRPKQVDRLLRRDGRLSGRYAIFGANAIFCLKRL